MHPDCVNVSPYFRQGASSHSSYIYCTTLILIRRHTRSPSRPAGRQCHPLLRFTAHCLCVYLWLNRWDVRFFLSSIFNGDPVPSSRVRICSNRVLAWASFVISKVSPWPRVIGKLLGWSIPRSARGLWGKFLSEETELQILFYYVPQAWGKMGMSLILCGNARLALETWCRMFVPR